jgi:hypothetical protein
VSRRPRYVTTVVLTRDGVELDVEVSGEVPVASFPRVDDFSCEETLSASEREDAEQAILDTAYALADTERGS